MTTLKSILETERRPEVIFGHIRRRQDEINSILGRGCERERAYEKLQEIDILDLYVIRSFFESLTGHWDNCAREELEAYYHAMGRLGSAAKTSGIETDARISHNFFGIRLSTNVMCPSDEAFNAYQAIYSRPELIAA